MRSIQALRHHMASLYTEGRPALYVAGLCGLIAAFFAPVEVSLALPFIAAAFGAVAVSVWSIEYGSKHCVTDIDYGAGNRFAALPDRARGATGSSLWRAMLGRHRARLLTSVGWLQSLLVSASSNSRVGPHIAPEQRLLSGLYIETFSLVGDEFVHAALAGIRRILGVRYVLLVETRGYSRFAVVKCLGEDREIPCFEFDVAGSPCESVLRQEACCYPAGVKERFPGHVLVQTLDAEGYFGFPLCDRDRRVIGLFALVDDKPLDLSELTAEACRPLVQRIGVEIERTRLEEDLRRREGRYRDLAFNDPLTGLANRLMLMDRLEHALQRGRRWGHGIALLFLDIDGFKRVNDGAGHDIGDQVLVDAATRIAACVRSVDTVARLGGDEFVVLTEQCGGESQARMVAEHILNAFSHRFRTAGRSWALSVSVGIALYPSDAQDDIQGSDLLKMADKAMYRSKQSGPGEYRFAP